MITDVKHDRTLPFVDVPRKAPPGTPLLALTVVATACEEVYAQLIRNAGNHTL